MGMSYVGSVCCIFIYYMIKYYIVQIYENIFVGVQIIFFMKVIGFGFDILLGVMFFLLVIDYMVYIFNVGNVIFGSWILF